ncbi:SMI1/KNR4 family protein [Streptomyces sp. NPDC058157]|uniref:SMI1/KNR4 family protein n=1 Tax=Streptomyces sp. NPDC058157 TaxID=3346360 RepID=UPI0036EA8E77
MSDEAFNWHAFLGRWQEEWVPPRDPDDGPDQDGPPGSFRLGGPAADEAAIRAAEVRLGRRLPASYRAFLAVSDGWYVEQMAGVYQLGGTTDIDWFRDPFDMTPLYADGLGENPREEEVLLAGMWRRALRLETESDMSYALLDPGDRDEDGEWALYLYQGWGGEPPRRYPSFRAYMEAMYHGFHATRAGDPGFVNATTRAQDARVEEARLLALRGRHEEAAPLLEEAFSFGRPHSGVLLQQVRQLSGRRVSGDYGLLPADPRHGPEVLPVQAMAAARDGQGPDGDDYWLGMMAARGVDREAARAVLGAVRDGTHRYAPPGLWGRAVAEAREAARWGATDAAWRVLREALPLWEAPGPSLIAPIGLLADPVLGPLLTPERGRELLATPRSGETGPVPEPVADLDPPGLGWLAGPGDGRGPAAGYRCVWVEGLDPAGLPALIGEEGAGLGVLTDRLGSWRRQGRWEREGVEPWEDRAAVAVGRTAEGWAFAFDGDAHHLGDRFVSPAVAASAHGRAVVVWREPERHSPDDQPPAFHLSVAERGEEVYAFTVRGGEVQRSGTIPEALDPARLFRADDTPLDGVPRALEALHAELGLSLPRFALTQGALPTLTTRSWTRAPREGESFAYIRFVRHRG